MALLDYFVDPILRAPTIGSMLACLTSGLVGVVVVLRHQSLLGEVLAHASFPGVILGVLAAGILSLGVGSYSVAALILVGAFITALLGATAVRLLVQRFAVRSDSALCFVLSAFFGVGLTLASHVQVHYASLYQQVFVYLYGQTATMTDRHVQVYALLAATVVVIFTLFYKEIQAVTFDSTYATTLGMRSRLVDNLLLILTAIAVVIGIRSIGVVLMSAMFIAPAVTARQLTQTLSKMLLLAGLIGMVSGFCGVYISSELSELLAHYYTRLSLPTGPVIVLVSATLCITALLFAPHRGVLLRYIRIARFRFRCVCENLLKTMWRLDPNGALPLQAITHYQTASSLYLRFVMGRLVQQGWVEKRGPEQYALTAEGKGWAAKIVRLHRLWEVYLADYLSVGAERVHRSAEEMEHIITPRLEKELTLLLNDPEHDPHQQPIPPSSTIGPPQ